MSLVSISGATGFIGNYLTWKFINEGYKVEAFVRNEKSDTSSLQHKNIIIKYSSDLPNSKSICFFQLAVNKFNGQDFNDNPDTQLENTKIHFDYLKKVVEAKIPRFISIGTKIELIGNNLYQFTKKIINLTNSYFVEGTATKVSHVRPGSLYGDFNFDNRKSLIQRFFEHDNNIVINNGGKIYEYIHIDDVVNALYLIGTANKIESEYNIFGEWKTLKYYCDILSKITNTPYKILDSFKENDDLIPPEDKNLSKLGWKEKVNFEKGIKKLASTF
jgi:nucleoside-diphosphate-sugar epimerase